MSNTTLVYRLEDYVLIRPNDIQDHPCRGCGQDHQMYTHGCKPAAFHKDDEWGLDVTVLLCTPDAVPLNNIEGCPTPATQPHEHPEIRWE